MLKSSIGPNKSETFNLYINACLEKVWANSKFPRCLNEPPPCQTIVHQVIADSHCPRPLDEISRRCHLATCRQLRNWEICYFIENALRHCMYLVKFSYEIIKNEPRTKLFRHGWLLRSILLKINEVNTKKNWSWGVLGPKIQDGGQARDMVTLTFFLWEINPKFFFLAWGFWVLGMQWNYFENRGRGILANSADFHIFLRFLTNFHCIWTVIAYKVKNMVSLIGFWGIGNVLLYLSKLSSRYFSTIRRILLFFGGF